MSSPATTAWHTRERGRWVEQAPLLAALVRCYGAMQRPGAHGSQQLLAGPGGVAADQVGTQGPARCGSERDRAQRH